MIQKHITGVSKLNLESFLSMVTLKIEAYLIHLLAWFFCSSLNEFAFKL